MKHNIGIHLHLHCIAYWVFTLMKHGDIKEHKESISSNTLQDNACLFGSFRMKISGSLCVFNNTLSFLFMWRINFLASALLAISCKPSAFKLGIWSVLWADSKQQTTNNKQHQKYFLSVQVVWVILTNWLILVNPQLPFLVMNGCVKLVHK